MNTITINSDAKNHKELTYSEKLCDAVRCGDKDKVRAVCNGITDADAFLLAIAIDQRGIMQYFINEQMDVPIWDCNNVQAYQGGEDALSTAVRYDCRVIVCFLLDNYYLLQPHAQPICDNVFEAPEYLYYAYHLDTDISLADNESFCSALRLAKELDRTEIVELLSKFFKN